MTSPRRTLIDLDRLHSPVCRESPDGHHLVTTAVNHTAQIWGLVAGRWQGKSTTVHSGRVRNASFSPGGSHLVTACDNQIAKICELVVGQWREKATIQHFS